ncbi:hypothetical protein C8J57DRAFT_1507589 [Mycena rebaudengoi]|nr:hypothetical protein C8J57DRAFT_1507589 [Mycena rebaudengoi]
MSGKLDLNFLADPTPPTLVNIRPQLDQLASIPTGEVPAPISLVDRLVDSISYLSCIAPPSSPSPGFQDMRPHLHQLAALTLDPHIMAPPAIARPLTDAIAYINRQGQGYSKSPFSLLPSSDLGHFLSPTPASSVRSQVKIMRETTLDTLYSYKSDAVVEYPATSKMEK